MPGPYARLFASLNRHRVRYLTIGGLAAIVHGVPRVTLDVDLLVEPTEANVTRLLRALEEAGLGTAVLTDTQSILSHQATIFEDYVRLDVLTSAAGLDFASAWSRRVIRRVEGVRVKFASLDDLIRSKQACGRPKDLEDVRLLRRVRRRRQT